MNFLNKTFLIYLIFLAFWASLEACKITIKIKSNTLNEFQIQIFIPSIKQKSERITFNGKEERILKVIFFNLCYWHPISLQRA